MAVDAISVGGGPETLGVNPNTNLIYVSNTSHNTVSVINCDINTIIVTIPVGNNPVSAVVDSSENLIFVTNAIDRTISVIDGAENIVIATISVGNTPYGIGLLTTTS